MGFHEMTIEGNKANLPVLERTANEDFRPSSACEVCRDCDMSRRMFELGEKTVPPSGLRHQFDPTAARH